MSISQSAHVFDAAYQQLIHGIAHENPGEVEMAYQSWSRARRLLADHLLKATECADLGMIHAIDSFMKESIQSLNGDGETFLEQYPKYVVAREELGRLAHDEILALVAGNREMVLEQEFFTAHGGFDIKSLLDGFKTRPRVFQYILK